jgi:murein DD-endopeptidase MepM/ murein hydrolase activator NlpD
VKRSWRLLIFILLVGLIVAGYFYLRRPAVSVRTAHVMEFLRNPQNHPDWMVKAGAQCGEAPFVFPTDGFIGYLWDDSFQAGSRHQGLDIFGGAAPGQTPVRAAYAGYLTRLPDWKSAVIVRIPRDPLQLDRQIWTYYAHMADPNGNSFISLDFPAGTAEKFVKAGTLLGYQGDYSGDPLNPVGVHLHFSIVQDDGLGHFRNELEISNTFDPSPYFGMSLNANDNTGEIPLCK